MTFPRNNRDFAQICWQCELAEIGLSLLNGGKWVKLGKPIAQQSLRLNDSVNIVYTNHFPSWHVYGKCDVSELSLGGVETSWSGCESKVIDNHNNKKIFTGWNKSTFCFFFVDWVFLWSVLKGVKWRLTTAKEEIKRLKMAISYLITQRIKSLEDLMGSFVFHAR